MRNSILTALCGAGLVLAGCGGTGLSTPTAATPSANAPDTCNAAAYQSLIGQEAASSLTLPEPKRLVGPTDAVTTGFMAGRLNIQLDDTDNIIAITCG